jgi:hypothetical protein
LSYPFYCILRIYAKRKQRKNIAYCYKEFGFKAAYQMAGQELPKFDLTKPVDPNRKARKRADKILKHKGLL